MRLFCKYVILHLLLITACFFPFIFPQQALFAAAENGYVRYSNDFFSCLLPDGWEMFENTSVSREASKIYTVVAARGEGLERVSISVEFYSEENLLYPTMKRYLESQIRQVPTNDPELKKYEIVSDTELAGLSAKTFERLNYRSMSRFHRNQVAILERYYLAEDAKGFYVLKYQVPKEMDKTFDFYFEKVVNTFTPSHT